ncbi:MAG: hypothetical protein ABIG84_02690 [archaeon]
MPNDIEKNNGLSPQLKIEDKPTSDSSTTSKIKEEDTLEPKITTEEFEALEKKEQNKKLFGFLQKLKKDKDARESSTDMNQSNVQYIEKKLNDTLLKVEKMEGKFEMIESSKSETNDRIADLAEKIGELRSMIFSREDTFSGIETEFENIKESTAHMKPEKIHKEIEENALEVMKVQAQLELEKSKIDRLEKTQVKLTKLLDRFKSFENLLDVSKEIKAEIEQVKDSEKYTSRMAAKTEKIFSELDNRLSEFQKYKKEVNDMNELIKDLIRSNDTLEVKTDSLMSKDSFSKIREDQETKAAELDTRIKILKDIVSTLVDKMSRENLDLMTKDNLEKMRLDIRDELRKESLKDIDGLNKSIKSISDTTDNLQNNIKRMQDIIDGLVQSTSKESLDSAVATITEKNIQFEAGLSKLADMLSIMQKNDKNTKQELLTLKKYLETKMAQISTTGLKEKDLRHGLEKGIKELEQKEQYASQQHQELSEKINEISTQINESISTITLLEDNGRYMKESIDDLARPSLESSEKELNKKIDELKNKISVLADIISLMQKNERIFKQDFCESKKNMDISSNIVNMEDNIRYMKDSIDIIPTDVTDSDHSEKRILTQDLNNNRIKPAEIDRETSPSISVCDHLPETHSIRQKDDELTENTPSKSRTKDSTKYHQNIQEKQVHGYITPQLDWRNPIVMKADEIRNDSLCHPVTKELPEADLVPQKHMEKIKGLFNKIKSKSKSKSSSIPKDECVLSAQSPVQIPNPVENPKKKEMTDIKESQKDSMGANKIHGTNLTEEISRLKSLYHEKEALLEAEKRSGKDIFNQETLLENASLDLSMAELDLLDGNETTSRQKIERINALLENVR